MKKHVKKGMLPSMKLSLSHGMRRLSKAKSSVMHMKSVRYIKKNPLKSIGALVLTGLAVSAAIVGIINR